jgi:hypothetical protein
MRRIERFMASSSISKNEPIGGNDQFPQALLPIFRHDSTNPREALKGFDLGDDQIAETSRHLPVIPRDVADDVTQIRERDFRPDYLESDPLKRLRTSSWGTTSPRRTSSRAFSMAARK